MWDRITFSRLTTVYFIFSAIHFLIQVALQSKAFSINATAASFLSSILVQGNVSTRAFPVFDHDLRLCDYIPSSLSANSCTIVWDGTPRDDNWLCPANNSSTVASTLGTATTSSDGTSSSPSYTIPSPIATVSVQTTQTTSFTLHRAVTITIRPAAVTPSASAAPTPSPSGSGLIDGSLYESNYDNDLVEKKCKRGTIADGIQAFEDGNRQVEVILTGLLWSDTVAVLNSECLWALTYPVSILLNTKREDIVFIAFQFWLLGMSTVALLNESIPHILASLLTHMLATAWAAFQIKRTSDFHAQFARLTTNGACKPLNVLPQYWRDRSNAEIPSLALNALGLVASAFLTWRLIKLFGWQTFKRVGASLTINRVYKIVLTLSITIQLSLFFMVVTVALWIDQLFNGQIAQLAKLATLYKFMFTATLVLLVPWLMMGWFAVRRELRIPMMIFLVLSIGYLAGWAIMFLSHSFRWTFVQWRFFSLMAIASVLLTLTAFVLGIICRANFGKGLSRHLNAQHRLPDDDFVRAYTGAVVDPDKVDFPPRKTSIPTFSVTFGLGLEVPPGQMRFAPHMGPRFYNPAPPFEFQGNQLISNPAPVHSRNLSNASCRCQDANSTHYLRAGSQSSGNGLISGMNSKRWIIE